MTTSPSQRWCDFLEAESRDGAHVEHQQVLYDEISADTDLSQTLLHDSETHGLLQAACYPLDSDTSGATRGLDAHAIADRVISAIAGEQVERIKDSRLDSMVSSSNAAAVASQTLQSRAQRPAGQGSHPAHPAHPASREPRPRRAPPAIIAAGVVGGLLAASLCLLLASQATHAPTAPQQSANADVGKAKHSDVERPSDAAVQSMAPAGSNDREPDGANDRTPSDTELVTPDNGLPSHSTDGGENAESPPAPRPLTNGSRTKPAPSAPSAPSAPAVPPKPHRDDLGDWQLAAVQDAPAPEWASPLPRDIRGKTLRLLKGAVTLMIPSAGEFTVHAPAEFRPDHNGLMLKHGEIMARVIQPTRIDTPASQLEIINRASIVADEYGTAVRANEAVGVIKLRGRPSIDTAIPPGEYRWISNNGEIHHWMVAMLEANGAMVLAVNDQLCPLSATSLSQPGFAVTTAIARQVARTPASDLRGAVLVNGVQYNYRGPRGIRQAGKRINDQCEQRRRAAVARGDAFIINGMSVGKMLPAAHNVGGNPVLGGAGPVAQSVPAQLFDQQLRMIDTMNRSFGVDLSGARRSVEEARARFGRNSPPTNKP